MPLYEYHCVKDGTFEQVRKFSDPPLEKCPTCGGPIEKLLSAPAIQFKGTGWYITDYARKGDGGGKKDAGSDKASGSSEKASGSSEKASGGSSSSASDSKSTGSSSGSGDKK